MTVRPPLPAVDRDWSILSKLLLGFMHLANKINESLPRFGHALLWPISKLELPYCPGLAILQIQGKDSEVRRWRLVHVKSSKRKIKQWLLGKKNSQRGSLSGVPPQLTLIYSL